MFSLKFDELSILDLALYFMIINNNYRNNYILHIFRLHFLT